VAERSRNADDVGAEIDDVVGVYRGRLIAAAITSLVWDRDLEARLDNWIDLVPPQIPALWESVQQNYQRAAWECPVDC